MEDHHIKIDMGFAGCCRFMLYASSDAYVSFTACIWTAPPAAQGRERTAAPIESGRWASASSTSSAHQVRTTASFDHYFSLPAGERLLSGADRSFAQKSPTGSNGSFV